MPSPLASLEPPVPCARCLRKIPRLKWGDLCPDCEAQLRARAIPAARSISMGAALLVVGYALFRIPLGPASRVWVAAVAIGTYFLVRKIVLQVAVEVLRKS
jgi:Zn finger protein HypA/HybF involved in hydrogenase expression